MKLLTIIGVGVTVAMVLPLLTALFGGFCGFMVGGIFPMVVANLNEIAGMSMSGWEWGSMLGFFGGFFKSPSATDTSKR